MNDRRLILTGRLAQAKADRDRLSIEMRGLVSRVQSLVDPYAEHLDLALDEAQLCMARLVELQQQLRSSQALIDRLEEDLYGKT